MLFSWNERTISWISDGAEYTGFYRNLAALLLRQIRVRGSLCDMGCGMALADFALAPELERVTCVDIDSAVLDFVRRRAAAGGVGNLTAVQSDGPALAGRWDTVTAMFHSRVEEMCESYLSKAADRLIVVTHGPGESAWKPCDDAAVAAAWLDERGYVYEKRLGELEFGQPFRSREDAGEWARVLRGGRTEADSRERVLAALRETGRQDFPFYLPKQRTFGIFVIPRAENERLLGRRHRDA